jgi:hypothetical protein
MSEVNLASEEWTCHWADVAWPVDGARELRTRVYLCQHPYRTMRSGPCDECPSCDRQMARPAATPDPNLTLAER